MDQITQLLQALATQLGVTVTQLWPYLVRYTYAKHFGNLVLDVSLMIISAFLVIYGSKVIRAHYDKEIGGNGPSNHFLATAVGAVLVFIFGFVFISEINDIPTQLAAVIAPEAQAIYDVIAQLQTVKK